MNNKKTKIYHERLAKTVTELYYYIYQLKLNKKIIIKLNKLLINIKGECDNLIQETNPEIKDNITWYYGKFRK